MSRSTVSRAEAMAFGPVPVVADLPAAAQTLSGQGCGSVVSHPDPAAWSAAIRRYVDDPSGWEHESRQALDLARRFTYETYLGRVRSLLVQENDGVAGVPRR